MLSKVAGDRGSDFDITLDDVITKYREAHLNAVELLGLRLYTGPSLSNSELKPRLNVCHAGATAWFPFERFARLMIAVCGVAGPMFEFCASVDL